MLAILMSAKGLSSTAPSPSRAVVYVPGEIATVWLWLRGTPSGVPVVPGFPVLPVMASVPLPPGLDDRSAAAKAPNPAVGEFVWTPASNHFGWSALLGHEPGIDGVSPYAAAARATDLAGLPPTFIGVGALDLFLEEDVEFARRLVRAGVPTELHVYPGACHGFNVLVPAAQVSQAYQRDFLAALRRAFAAGGDLPHHAAAHRLVQQLADGRAMRGAQVHAVAGRAVLQEGVEDAQLAERANRRAAQADAGAVAAPARVDLDQVDVGTALAQLDGRGHAREAAANDQDAPGCQRHGVSPFVD